MELVEKTYDVYEVAKILKCSRWKVDQLVKDHQLEHFHVGNRVRVSNIALSNYIRDQEKKSKRY